MKNKSTSKNSNNSRTPCISIENITDLSQSNINLPSKTLL